MEKFIKSSSSNKKNIIQKTANDLGLRFDIVEKDIWVCYVLQKLFSNEKLKNNLIFKGGTCLSKAYDAIGRFSEDIDITINSDALEILGKSQKIDKIKSKNKKAARKFVENEILPILNTVFNDELGNDNYKLSFDELDQNNVTLFFEFPQSENDYLLLDNGDHLTLDDGSKIILENDYYHYIKPKIKLEFGALGGIWPSERKLIKPYAEQILPEYFNEFEVNTLSIKRNFIEKLLILHAITLLPTNELIKQNYSRHYYDIYSIIKNGINVDLMSDLEILESVVDNESKFWTKKWVDYDKIKKFSDIKLIPNNSRIVEIKKDFKNMENMFFKDFPKFEEMILELQEFEKYLSEAQ